MIGVQGAQHASGTLLPGRLLRCSHVSACRETHLLNESDHALVHTTHQALIDHPLTLQLLLSFIQHQRFTPESRTLQSEH